MNAPMMIDYQKDGKTVKGLVTPARNGYLYWLRAQPDGTISFVDAQPYVKQNVFKSIDPKTGRPDVDPDHKPGTGKEATFCPCLWGGKDWPFEAYNPKTGMIYIPANDNHCGHLEGKVQEYVAGQWWTGVDIPDIGFTVDKNAALLRRDPGLGRQHRQEGLAALYPNSMMWGSVLTTAGNLVFAGGTNDRDVPRLRRAGPASSSGSSRPTPASSPRPRPSRSTASSTSPWSPAGASTPPASRR